MTFLIVMTPNTAQRPLVKYDLWHAPPKLKLGRKCFADPLEKFSSFQNLTKGEKTVCTC